MFSLHLMYSRASPSCSSSSAKNWMAGEGGQIALKVVWASPGEDITWTDGFSLLRLSLDR